MSLYHKQHLHFLISIYSIFYFPNFILPKYREHLPACDTSYTPTNLYSIVFRMHRDLYDIEFDICKLYVTN